MASRSPPNSISKRKAFLPLENNPVVFSKLSATLGAEPGLGFYDIYSVDDPDLLTLIPRPAYALLFTCPRRVFEKARNIENDRLEDYTGAGAGEPVIWFKQTIGGACGLIALLHGLSNGDAKRFIKQDSFLDTMLQQALPLSPVERAELLHSSEALEAAHRSVAELGDTAPEAEDRVGNHYICFVKGDDGHLWELNGGMKGPLDQGQLAMDDDALSKAALELGVQSIMRHAGSDDLDFSMVAMARAS